jgi:hypothetical protein
MTGKQVIGSVMWQSALMYIAYFLSFCLVQSGFCAAFAQTAYPAMTSLQAGPKLLESDVSAYRTWLPRALANVQPPGYSPVIPDPFGARSGRRIRRLDVGAQSTAARLSL